MEPIPHPHTLGNVWHLRQEEDGSLRYLSDQWGGRVFGFEERDRVTLAQSDEVAIGIISLGGGSAGVTRPLIERHPFHLRNEHLESDETDLSAEAQAVAWLRGCDARRYALPTVIGLSEPRASVLEADVLPGGALRTKLQERLRTAVDALRPWGKRLFVDRISLSLLEGDRNVTESVADFHYAAIANGVRMEVADITGQAALPLMVVTQAAGTRRDGGSEVILAEGRLHWNHFALGIVVATPRYPFVLMPSTPGTLDADAALLVSEMESRAIEARHDGQDWFCPSLEEARLNGRHIRARFTTLSPLVLDPDRDHGFRVDQGEIASVKVDGAYVEIELAQDPSPDATPQFLHYAWGMQSDDPDEYPANRGALRDQWQDVSRFFPEKILHRYALSGRSRIRDNSGGVTR